MALFGRFSAALFVKANTNMSEGYAHKVFEFEGSGISVQKAGR